MKSENLKIAAEKAKIEINDEIDNFIHRLDNASENPNDFITMTELEEEWRSLSLKTHKTYSDLVSESISTLGTKELNISKKPIPQGRNPTEAKGKEKEVAPYP